MGNSRSLNFAPLVAMLLDGKREGRRFTGTILDIGMGNGFLGAVVRNWLEWPPTNRTIRLVGVEPFGQYRNGLWDLYDEVHVASAQDVLDGPMDADLAVMFDAIEHMERPDGERVLDLALSRFPRLAVACPDGFMPQGEDPWGDGETAFETHLSGWTAEDFLSRGMRVLRLSDPGGTGLFAFKWAEIGDLPHSIIEVR